jgi:phenylacetate-coenzyme A ligase PaaK-like adenylate-forming protein
MTELDDVFELAPYESVREDKRSLLIERLNELQVHHREKCEPYRKVLNAFGRNGTRIEKLEEFPYLPIRLFKEFELKSVDGKEVFKTLTSSGTTGAKVSKIFLDKETSRYQTKALATIMQDFIGKKRLPMLIIDSSNVIKDRRLFSARGAGILGMANFGHDHHYVLDDQMKLKVDELERFCEKFRDEQILLFGFTFMVWQHFYQELKKLGKKVDLSKGILIHSGGWKKLTEQAVDNATFKRSLAEVCGLKRIHNFYGMVEQIGSVYMECEEGHFHTPIFSDIIIRDPFNWSPLPAGEEGVVELLSILPRSYPGHVLLTEDMGTVLGEDDCPCGRKGKYFRLSGRIPQAEVRGCSDTYEG